MDTPGAMLTRAKKRAQENDLRAPTWSNISEYEPVLPAQVNRTPSNDGSTDSDTRLIERLASWDEKQQRKAPPSRIRRNKSFMNLLFPPEGSSIEFDRVGRLAPATKRKNDGPEPVPKEKRVKTESDGGNSEFLKKQNYQTQTDVADQLGFSIPELRALNATLCRELAANNLIANWTLQHGRQSPKDPIVVQLKEVCERVEAAVVLSKLCDPKWTAPSNLGKLIWGQMLRINKQEKIKLLSKKRFDEMESALKQAKAEAEAAKAASAQPSKMALDFIMNQ